MEVLSYFKKFELIIKEKIDDKKTLLCFHPHNVYSLGILGNINLKIDGFKILGSRFALNVPLLGMLLRMWDVSGVNPSNFKKLCS